jgi:hypothetical protein
LAPFDGTRRAGGLAAALTLLRGDDFAVAVLGPAASNVARLVLLFLVGVADFFDVLPAMTNTPRGLPFGH